MGMTASPDAGQSSPFGQLLRQHRRALGLTQEMLAERSGMSVETISALERGVHQAPRRDTVALLADTLSLEGERREAFTLAARRSGRPRPERPPVAPALPGALPLVGRARELAEASALLLRFDGRLLTLTGPPGVGKTRLALALAARLPPEFPDGVALVELAPVAQPEMVGPAIRRALGVSDERPLATHIGGRRMLLVLDNLEHLLPAAPMLGELLAGCPGLRLLVTSRSPLHLTSEQELAIAPLPLSDAVTLLVQRAQARMPGLDLASTDEPALADICHRLDCLPLALLLAAPWIRLLGPEGLRRRLTASLPILVGGPVDLPERQRTMRGTLEWSYQLLAPEEQAILRRLSVFAGGATLDAVEAVSADGPAGRSALHLVASLVDKNLVVREGGGAQPRVGLLETVREFARALLEAGGELEAAAAAHARHFAAFVEGAEPNLGGAEQQPWLARLERELPNLRAALSWARERDPDLGLRMAARLQLVWETGHAGEGIGWLDGWLESDAGLSLPVRAMGLLVRAILAFRTSDYATAARRGEEALALHRRLGDGRGVATALNYLAGSAWEQGQMDRAAELCEESLALRRQHGTPGELAASLANLATILHERGDRRARELAEEGLRIYRGLGRTRGLGICLGFLAVVAVHEGDLDRGEALMEESLALAQQRTDLVIVGQSHHLRGRIARCRGDLAGAAESYRRALRYRLEVGTPARAAFDIDGLATVAYLEGRAERAARLLGAADAVRNEGGGRQRFDREDREWHRARVRETLGEEAFQRAYTAGLRLSPEEAVSEALE
jgi:predicted ATPase/DNA-binding XRE family transcriptional regulator